VSSILEALKELEGNKPSARRSRIAWATGAAEERTPLARAAEVLGVVAFGLALGGAGFGLVLWLGASGEPTPATPPVPTAVARPTATPPSAVPPPLAPAPPAPSAPAWLARMGTPRGQVADGDDARPAARADDQVAPRAVGLRLVDVRYAESRADRSATLRIDGSAVVLHEGDTAHGIELQLVTPTGAYVRRGNEVLMLEPSR
jgi:hypothetical protein